MRRECKFCSTWNNVIVTTNGTPRLGLGVLRPVVRFDLRFVPPPRCRERDRELLRRSIQQWSDGRLQPRNSVGSMACLRPNRLRSFPTTRAARLRLTDHKNQQTSRRAEKPLAWL